MLAVIVGEWWRDLGCSHSRAGVEGRLRRLVFWNDLQGGGVSGVDGDACGGGWWRQRRWWWDGSDNGMVLVMVVVVMLMVVMGASGRW